MIDRATITRILNVANIVEVVSEFVTLRKAGTNYKGLCPFHDEKTPSFVVSPAKGLCKCFSCGKGGTSVGFIMEHEQLSYPEALRWLANKYHIDVAERELTNEERQSQNERESMFLVNEWARDYFQDTLFNHALGKAEGMTYFRGRGFRDDIIRKFQLGFCLPRHDTMAQAAVAKGYQPAFLEKTGLCYKTDQGKLRDRYHGRVIFPVHTISGKVVAFGGRVLSTEGKVAKYVNSPESDIYHKSNELYGIFFAKQAIVKQDRCYLVEGYTDVISMHQSGIENVVASSGTSLTEGQIRLIHRFTENITILYDGDKAGIKAALRGVDMLLEEGMNIKILLLPDGDDPDSFARKHTADEYRAYIEKYQIDFIRFKTNLLLEDAAGDPLKKAQLIANIVKSISVIPDAIVRSIYIKECGHLLDAEEALLVREVARLRKEAWRAQQREAQQQEERAAATAATSVRQDAEAPAEALSSPSTVDDAPAAPFFPEETQLIQAVIRYGEKMLTLVDPVSGNICRMLLAAYVDEELRLDELAFQHPIYRQILAEALAHLTEPDFVAQTYFLTHPQAEISLLTAQLVPETYPLSKLYDSYRQAKTEAAKQGDTKKEAQIEADEQAHLCKELSELTPRLIIDLKWAIVQKQLKEVLHRLATPEAAQDEQLFQTYIALKKIESSLAKQAGERVITSL